MPKEKQKIVMLTSLQPYSNYSLFLCQHFDKEEVDLIVYAEDDSKNNDLKDCGDVKAMWTRDISMFFSVFKHLKEDKPDILHIQYEINMYGGVLVNALFPLFLLILKNRHMLQSP